MNPPNHRLSRARHALRSYDLLAAVAIFAAYLALMLATPQMGFTRDESFYWHAGRDYVGWFNDLEQNLDEGRPGQSFTQASVDRHWGYNPEHPVLMKALFGLAWEHLAERRDVLSPTTAMRLPAMAFSAMLMAVLYLFTFEVTGRRLAAWIAVAMMVAHPRFFFDAHLICFDAPIAAMWFVTIWAYWKSFDSDRWAWIAGVLWGVALITKHNAMFMPVVLLAHWVLAWPREFGVVQGRLVVPPVPRALFTMVVLGPLIFYAGWPRHWYDTYNRIAWYFAFHVHHEHYFVAFFGQNLIRPPFPVIFPFALTAVTTPVVSLLAMIAGSMVAVVDWLREWARRGPLGGDAYGTGVLIALNIAFPFVLIALPSTPVFGGVKHWYSAIPFLCMMGGYGVARAVDALQVGTVARGLVGVLTVACIAVPGGLAVARNHPFGTSYFNELIGGTSGAADAGMMRQFWGYAARQALPWLNEHAPRGATVYLVDTTGIAWDMYRAEGLVRDDLRPVWDPAHADFALYDHDKAFFHEQSEIWLGMGTRAPVHVVAYNGVPMISVYARPGLALEGPDGPRFDRSDEAALEGSAMATDGSASATDGSSSDAVDPAEPFDGSAGQRDPRSGEAGDAGPAYEPAPGAPELTPGGRASDAG